MTWSKSIGIGVAFGVAFINIPWMLEGYEISFLSFGFCVGLSIGSLISLMSELFSR